MSAITWSEAVPSNASLVGDTAIVRSMWTAISTALATDLLWDGVGGASAVSRGELRLGASRTFVAAQSASSNSNNAKLLGRAFWASDTSQLLVYESNGTYRFGTPFVHRYGSGASLGGAAHFPIRELSGFTRVSDVTTTSTGFVSITVLEAGSALFDITAAFASASDRSVLVRPVINVIGGPVTTLLVTYRATANGPSATTLHWTTIGRSDLDTI